MPPGGVSPTGSGSVRTLGGVEVDVRYGRLDTHDTTMSGKPGMSGATSDGESTLPSNCVSPGGYTDNFNASGETPFAWTKYQ